MFFSIIVPAYNSALFITKCIDSVLTQTYSEFELILVDDGSKDNTLSICNEYAEIDSRVKVIHKDNGGHTSARTEGLKRAIGDYMLFLDSDDWIASQTLEICNDKIVSDNSDILIFRMQNSNAISPYSILLPDGCYDIQSLEKSEMNSFIIGKDGKSIFPKSLSAKCFKRDIIFKILMDVPQEITIGEDGAAFIGSLLQSKSICVIASDERACYYCFVRTDSVSRTADEAAFKKTILLLLFYKRILTSSTVDYSQQYFRYVIAQLYTAVILVIRSAGTHRKINEGLDKALKHPVILTACKEAKFSLKGYKYLIKKFIIHHRLWWIAKMLDGLK